MLPELGTYTVTILLRAKEQITQGVNKATAAMKKLQTTTTKLQKTFKRFEDTALGVVAGMAAFDILYRVTGGVEEAIDTFLRLERRLTALAVITRESGEAIGDVSQRYLTAAMDAARRFGIGVEDAAIALDSLVRAGLSGADAIKALDATLALATAEGANVAQVADILASTLAQFGLNADEAMRAADALTNAASIGVSTMTQYANGLSYCGAVARQLGFNLKETLAALVMVDASIKDANKSGRYLQAMLSAMAEKADDLGFSIYDANGKMLDMGEILVRLYNHLKTFGSEQERNTYLFKIFGEQGARAVSAIIAYMENQIQAGKDLNEVWDELTRTIGKSGTAMAVVGEIMDTTAGSIAQLKSAVEGLNLSLLQGMAVFAPYFQRMAENVDVLGGLLRMMHNLEPTTMQWASALKKLYTVDISPLIESWFPDIKAWNEFVREAIDNSIDFSRATDKASSSVDQGGQATSKYNVLLEKLNETLNEAKDAQQEYDREIRETIDTTLEYSNLVERLAREFDLPIEKVDQLTRGLLGLNFVYDEHADIKDMLINKLGIEASKVEALISELEKEAEAQKEASENTEEHAGSLRSLGDAADEAKKKVDALRNVMDHWGHLESTLDYLTSRVNAALDARRALYLESGDALEILNKIFSRNADYVRDHMDIVLENVKVLQEQGFMTQEQVKRFEELLPRVHRNREAYEELEAAVEAANEAYQKQTSLTREQEITMERLRVIGEHLSLVQQGIQLQMQAMTLEALGNKEAADKLREAWSKVKDALEDGTISADEFQDILSSLSETPFDVSFDLSPLENAFTDLTTKVDQKFMDLTTNVVAKVNEELTPKIQEAAQTVQTTVDETVAPAMDTWLQKIKAVQGGYGDLLENTLPQVVTKIAEMGGLFATMKDETIPQLISKHNELTDKIIENTTKAEDHLESMKGKIREVKEAFNPGVVTAVQAAINKVERLKEKIDKLPSEKHITFYIHEKKSGGGGAAGGGIPKAQHGAWFTREGLYYVHRGEMILPRNVAEWFRRGGGVAASQKIVNVTIGDIIVNYNGFEGIRDIRDLAEAISREMARRWRAAL